MTVWILKIVAAVLTVGTGLLSLFKPSAVRSFTGLLAEGPRGVTEIRAIFGGLFVGIGAFPLAVGNPVAYRTLGVTYLTIGAVRAGSMVVDRSVDRSNLISLGAEIVLGLVLIL